MRHAMLVLVLCACGDGKSAPVVDGAPADTAVPADTRPPSLDDFTAAERALLDRLTPLPAVPADPTNAFADNAAAARLGQMLFFDKSYSGPIQAVAADTGSNG